MTRVARIGLFAALLTAVMATSSCRLIRRSAKAQPLPAPISVPAAQSAPPQEVSVPPAPDLPAPAPEIEDVPAVQPGQVPPPPRRRVSTPRPRPAPEQPAPEPAILPSPVPGATPQLGQMLSPQQQQAFNEEIDRNIAEAQRALGNLNGRRLTSEQQTYLERIRAFVQQALEVRRTDLFRARTLAERASLLAADLSRTLQ